MTPYIKVKTSEKDHIELPARFVRQAFAHAARLMGKTLIDLEQGMHLDILGLYEMYYCGIKEGCRFEGKACRVKDADDLMDILQKDEDLGGDAESQLLKLYVESKIVKEAIATMDDGSIVEKKMMDTPMTTTNGTPSDTSHPMNIGTPLPENVTIS